MTVIPCLQEEKRAKGMKELAEKLASRLTGDLSEDEMKAIMEDHEREVANLENALDSEKERQLASLRDKLRKRREEKEAALLRKQKDEVSIKTCVDSYSIVCLPGY